MPTCSGWLNGVRAWIEDNRAAIPFISQIREFVDAFVELFLAVLHGLSWPGLVAVAGAIGLAIGGWKLALLAATGVLSFGVLGLWDSSVDTLALTLAAVVLSLAIGIPLGILAGRNDRFMRFISPVLDAMQIMPTFVYLAPLALLFLLGPATAAIATLIYAMPAAIRITALGIRGVSPTSVEAAKALGSTESQIAAQGPAADGPADPHPGDQPDVMMALSMVVITVLVDAPGLGKDIIRALQQVDVGAAFDAGLAIVIIAVVFDRLTSGAGDRAQRAGGRQGRPGEAPAEEPRHGHRDRGSRHSHRPGSVVGPGVSGADCVLVPGLRERDHELAAIECDGPDREPQEHRHVRADQSDPGGPHLGAVVARRRLDRRARPVRRGNPTGGGRGHLPSRDHRPPALGAQHGDA